MNYINPEFSQVLMNVHLYSDICRLLNGIVYATRIVECQLRSKDNVNDEQVRIWKVGIV